MSKWISIKDYLPEDGIRILACTDCSWIGTCTYFSDINYFNFDLTDAQAEDKVTHWMPLPEPPIDTNK